MVSSEPWDVYRAARPLYAVSVALGLAPVRYVRVRGRGRGGGGDGGWGLRVSWPALLYAALIAALLCVAAVFHLDWASKYRSNINDPKIVFIDALLSVMTYGAVLGSVCASALLHRRRLGRLLATVAAVDRALVSDRAALYRCDRRRVLATLLSVGAALAAFAAYEAYTNTKFNPLDWFFLYVLAVAPICFTVVVDLQFVLAVLMVRTRFVRVNAYFRALLDECRQRNQCADSFLAIAERENVKNRSGKNEHTEVERTTSVQGPVRLDESSISDVFRTVYYADKSPSQNGARDEQSQPPGVTTLFRAHDSLCQAVDEVNTCFGFQVLLELVRLFIDSVCSVYYAVHTTWYHYVHWLLMDMVKMIALAISCHRCTSAAYATAPLISRLLLEPSSAQVRRLLARFSQQLLHTRVGFVACGLLTFHAPMLTQLTGAMATYIVILVQYKTAGEASAAAAANATAIAAANATAAATAAAFNATNATAYALQFTSPTPLDTDTV